MTRHPCNSLILLFALLIASDSTLANAQEDHTEGFLQLEFSSTSFSEREPLAILRKFLEIRGLSLSDGSFEFSSRREEGKLVLSLIGREYEDDSLLGENYIIVLIEVGDGFVVDSIGVQYICARGEESGVPQIAICP